MGDSEVVTSPEKKAKSEPSRTENGTSPSIPTPRLFFFVQKLKTCTSLNSLVLYSSCYCKVKKGRRS